MSESFKTMNIENMPKLPGINNLAMPDNIAPPTLDIAPPTMKSEPADSKKSFDETHEYFYKPELITFPDYSSEDELRKQFPVLSHFNYKVDKEQFNDPNNHFFIIRSNNIDDIHKVG